jgi:methylenetetrahydrofolate reductase (NADPH)
LKTFRQALQSAEFAVTAELSAQRETSIDGMLSQAADLAEFVDAVQVREDSHSKVLVSPLAVSSLLLGNGIDSIPSLSCRDRNRIALQSDLLGLRAMGVTSLILNRGKRFPKEIEHEAKPVLDINCRELVAMAHAMNEEEREGAAHEFVIGTGARAQSPGPGWSPEPLLDRASAGARFLQTQPCFDIELLERYMQRLVEARVTWHYSVIITLAPLPHSDVALRLMENSPETIIPKALIHQLETAADPEQEGIDICAGLMKKLAKIPGVTGVNLMTLGNPEAVVAAIDTSGLKPTS